MRDRAVEDFAGRAVDADGVAFLERHVAAGELAGVIVDVDVAGAGDADLAHLPGDESRVAGNAAAAVRMPSEAIMPRRSSGLVSMRASTTCLPWAASSSALLAVNTTEPEAAPGPAGKPVAISRPSFLAAA